MRIVDKDNWREFTCVPEAEKPYTTRVKELRGLIGVGVKEPDYAKALTIINEDSKLGLSEKELQVLTLLYRALSKNARRFANEKLLAEDHRGNSASHSLMAILRLDERMQGLPMTAELNTIRQQAALGILMHDVGEICGEFSSLAQRTADASLTEQPALEGLIVRHALALAAHAVDTGNENNFLENIDKLKSEITAANEAKKAGKSYKSAREILDSHPLPELSAENYLLTEGLAHHYERAESGIGFIPHLIKNAEHTQGTRHLLHFMEQGNFEMPLEQMPSRRVIRNMEYLESNLGDMCFASITPLQKEISRRWRDLMIDTTIDFLNSAAGVIDRKAPKDEPDGNNPMHHQYRTMLLSQHRMERIKQRGLQSENERSEPPKDERSADTLFTVETNYRISRIYRRAKEVDYFSKPGEVLGTMKELPEELKGLYPASAGRAVAARG